MKNSPENHVRGRLILARGFCDLAVFVLEHRKSSKQRQVIYDGACSGNPLHDPRTFDELRAQHGKSPDDLRDRRTILPDAQDDVMIPLEPTR